MPRPAAIVTRAFAPAVLAGALAGSCLAETTEVANAVVSHCAEPFAGADELAQGLARIAGLAPLSPDSLLPESGPGRTFRMALAYNAALEGIIGGAPVAPEDQLRDAFDRIAADTPWLFSAPGEGGGVAAYADSGGTLYVVERAITTGRQGRRTTRCLFIAPAGASPLIPDLPETAIIAATPSVTARGFSASAFQGQIPVSTSNRPNAEFSMVTMPIPPGSAVAEAAGIGGVTIFRQSISNRSSQ